MPPEEENNSSSSHSGTCVDVGDTPPRPDSAGIHRGNGPQGTSKKADRRLLMPVNRVVQLLVFLDMLSVSLVLSLLSSYFRDLRISTEHYGLMSSAYSLSQIVGGLVLGAMSDHVVSRRSVLVLSFLGSSVSYGTIAFSSSLNMLLAGRVLVGLVKQTMTISTAIVSENTTTANRSAELSKLSAAMTFSGIAGPAMGSFLYRQSKKLPPLVASGVFLLNTVVVLALLPAERHKLAGDATDAAAAAKKNDDAAGTNNRVDADARNEETTSRGSAVARFCRNVTQACSSGPTMSILVARLLFDFFMRALGANNFVGYFEERFNIESGSLGFISSYMFGVNFIMQLYVVGRLTSYAPETRLVWGALATSALMNLAEGMPSLFGLWAYLALIIPVRAVANATLSACLQSIFTQRVPLSDIGAALGALNVLKSASGVVGPLYGGKLMGTWGVLARPTVTAVHYAGFFVFWWVTEIRPNKPPAAGQGNASDANTDTDTTARSAQQRLKIE